MANKQFSKEQLAGYITSLLKEQPLGRASLIKEVFRQCHGGNVPKGTKDPGVYVSQLKSYITTAIDELTVKGSIRLEDQKYKFIQKTIVFDKDKCKKAILDFLRIKQYTKKELFTELERYFGIDKALDEDNTARLRQVCGHILAELQNGKLIQTNAGKYRLSERQKPKPKKLTKVEAFAEIFEILQKKGGSFFEAFTCSLLEKYFNTLGKDVTSCVITGGTNDGGIDCIINTVDQLGFADHILIQCKCRRNIQVSDTEIREFFGAMNIHSGSRGIMITTSSIHPLAEKTLSLLNNCVGIDWTKLCEIIEACEFGIKKLKNDAYQIDRTIFDD